MKIHCGSCRGDFEIEERLVAGAVDGKVECRHCGAPVVVKPEAPPAEASNPESPEGAAADFESLVADICEPGGGLLPPLPERMSVLREPLKKVARPVAPVRTRETRRETGAPGEAVSPPPPPGEPPPPEKPKQPARPARTLPSYNVSRSVVLDPEKLVENRVAAFFPDAPELEAYRVLRTRILQAAAEKGGNAVMITSALPLEGKTLTAVNLALTFSKTYLETALLVDCDLRQQKVHETLGYESDKGLGDYVTDGCPVSDMIVWPGVEKLSVISGGRTVAESSAFLSSPLLKELVEDMKGRYENRYIFFDVPPVLNGADALAFAPLADHILFVVRAGATPLPEVRRALGMLPRERVIGLVLNRQAEA